MIHKNSASKKNSYKVYLTELLIPRQLAARLFNHKKQYRMPSLETIEKFIQAVEQEPHDKVIEKFYTHDASIQENQNEPRVGKENLIENEKNMLKKALVVTSKCIRPIFQAENNVVIRWKFRFEWKDHSVTEIEEIAYQTWDGDKIKREHFFYDPKQFVPKMKA